MTKLCGLFLLYRFGLWNTDRSCVCSHTEKWFSVDEKEPVAHAIVEIIEAADLKPSDLNGQWFSAHISFRHNA